MRLRNLIPFSPTVTSQNSMLLVCREIATKEGLQPENYLIQKRSLFEFNNPDFAKIIIRKQDSFKIYKHDPLLLDQLTLKEVFEIKRKNDDFNILVFSDVNSDSKISYRYFFYNESMYYLNSEDSCILSDVLKHNLKKDSLLKLQIEYEESVIGESVEFPIPDFDINGAGKFDDDKYAILDDTQANVISSISSKWDEIFKHIELDTQKKYDLKRYESPNDLFNSEFNISEFDSKFNQDDINVFRQKMENEFRLSEEELKPKKDLFTYNSEDEELLKLKENKKSLIDAEILKFMKETSKTKTQEMKQLQSKLEELKQTMIEDMNAEGVFNKDLLTKTDTLILHTEKLINIDNVLLDFRSKFDEFEKNQYSVMCDAVFKANVLTEYQTELKEYIKSMIAKIKKLRKERNDILTHVPQDILMAESQDPKEMRLEDLMQNIIDQKIKFILCIKNDTETDELKLRRKRNLLWYQYVLEQRLTDKETINAVMLDIKKSILEELSVKEEGIQNIDFDQLDVTIMNVKNENIILSRNVEFNAGQPKNISSDSDKVVFNFTSDTIGGTLRTELNQVEYELRKSMKNKTKTTCVTDFLLKFSNMESGELSEYDLGEQSSYVYLLEKIKEDSSPNHENSREEIKRFLNAKLYYIRELYRRSNFKYDVDETAGFKKINTHLVGQIDDQSKVLNHTCDSNCVNCMNLVTDLSDGFKYDDNILNFKLYEDKKVKVQSNAIQDISGGNLTVDMEISEYYFDEMSKLFENNYIIQNLDTNYVWNNMFTKEGFETITDIENYLDVQEEVVSIDSIGGLNVPIRAPPPRVAPRPPPRPMSTLPSPIYTNSPSAPPPRPMRVPQPRTQFISPNTGRPFPMTSAVNFIPPSPQPRPPPIPKSWDSPKSSKSSKTPFSSSNSQPSNFNKVNPKVNVSKNNTKLKWYDKLFKTQKYLDYAMEFGSLVSGSSIAFDTMRSDLGLDRMSDYKTDIYSNNTSLFNPPDDGLYKNPNSPYLEILPSLDRPEIPSRLDEPIYERIDDSKIRRSEPTTTFGVFDRIFNKFNAKFDKSGGNNDEEDETTDTKPKIRNSNKEEIRELDITKCSSDVCAVLTERLEAYNYVKIITVLLNILKTTREKVFLSPTKIIDIVKYNSTLEVNDYESLYKYILSSLHNHKVQELKFTRLNFRRILNELQYLMQVELSSVEKKKLIDHGSKLNRKDLNSFVSNLVDLFKIRANKDLVKKIKSSNSKNSNVCSHCGNLNVRVPAHIVPEINELDIVNNTIYLEKSTKKVPHDLIGGEVSEQDFLDSILIKKDESAGAYPEHMDEIRIKDKLINEMNDELAFWDTYFISTQKYMTVTQRLYSNNDLVAMEHRMNLFVSLDNPVIKIVDLNPFVMNYAHVQKPTGFRNSNSGYSANLFTENPPMESDQTMINSMIQKGILPSSNFSNNEICYTSSVMEDDDYFSLKAEENKAIRTLLSKM
ncbi:hypothetical protein [Carp edema virus]|nr:hypothetical protein [Carp edema virus]